MDDRGCALREEQAFVPVLPPHAIGRPTVGLVASHHLAAALRAIKARVLLMPVEPIVLEREQGRVQVLAVPLQKGELRRLLDAQLNLSQPV